MPDETSGQQPRPVSAPPPAGFARGLLALLFIALGLFLVFKFILPAFLGSSVSTGSWRGSILDSATSILGNLKSTFWEEDSGKAQGAASLPAPSASPAGQTSQGNSAPTGASGTSPGKENTPGEEPIIPPWKSDESKPASPLPASKRKWSLLGGASAVILLVVLLLWLRRKRRGKTADTIYLRALGHLSGRVLYDSRDYPLSELTGKELYEKTDIDSPSPSEDLVVGVIARVEGNLREIVSQNIGNSGRFFLRVPHFKLEPLGDLSTLDRDLRTSFSKDKGLLVFVKNASGEYFFHCVPLNRSKLGRGGFGHIDKNNPPAKRIDPTAEISGRPIILSRNHKVEEYIIVPLPREKAKIKGRFPTPNSDEVPKADSSGGSPSSSNEEDLSEFTRIIDETRKFCEESISYFDKLKTLVPQLKEDNPILTINDNDNALFYREKNRKNLRDLEELLNNVATDLLRWLAYSRRFAEILGNQGKDMCGKIRTLIAVAYANPEWRKKTLSFKENFNGEFLGVKKKEKIPFKIFFPNCPPDREAWNKLEKEENKDTAEILSLEFLPLFLRLVQLNSLLEPYLETGGKNLKRMRAIVLNLKARAEKEGETMKGEEVNKLKSGFKISLKTVIEAFRRTELIISEFYRINESSKFDEVSKKLKNAARTKAREHERQKSTPGKDKKEVSQTINRDEQKPAKAPEREEERGNIQSEPAKVTEGNPPEEAIKLGINVPRELEGRYPEDFSKWKFEDSLDFFYRSLKRPGFHYNPEQNEIRIPSIEGDTNLKSFYTFLVNKGELQASLPEQKIKRVLKKNNLVADVKKENDFIFIYNKHTEKKIEPGELRLYLACKPEARDSLTVAFVKNFSKIPNLRSFKFYKGNEKRNDNMVLYFYTGTPAGEVGEVLKIIAGVASEFYNKGDSAFEEYLIPPLCSRSLIFRNTVIGELTYWPLKSSEEDYGISVEIPEEWRDETTPSGYILSVETPNDFKAKMITILDLLTRIFGKNESLPDVPSAGHVIKTVSKVLLRSNTRGKELDKGLDGLCGELSRGILTYLR